MKGCLTGATYSHICAHHTKRHRMKWGVYIYICIGLRQLINTNVERIEAPWDSGMSSEVQSNLHVLHILQSWLFCCQVVAATPDGVPQYHVNSAEERMSWLRLGRLSLCTDTINFVKCMWIHVNPTTEYSSALVCRADHYWMFLQSLSHSPTSK